MEKSLLVGADLALSLGWLWFPWLADVWLPGPAWGSAASGSGAAILACLMTGCVAGILIGDSPAPLLGGQ